jgi:hypothetical protein
MSSFIQRPLATTTPGGLPPGLKAGDAIRFDFVITRDGEYQTTKVERAGTGAKAADPHAGHGSPK